MTSKTLIIFWMFTGWMVADIYPEDGAVFNYTEIFFRWDQIPDAVSYSLEIQNIDDGEDYTYIGSLNSHLVNEYCKWSTSYTWHIRAANPEGELIYTGDEISFLINTLPDYFPNQVNIITYNESLSQEGITVMDFESLDFSGGLDKDGNPVWFVPKEGFAEKFVFTQFLPSGNVVGFGTGRGYEIDLNGNIVFEVPVEFGVHHDINKTTDNTYFLISGTVEDQYCPEECNDMLPDEIPWQGDIFREIDRFGNEIWSWNTFDHFDSTEYNPYYVEIYNGNNEMDWTHSNSVFFDNNSQSVFVSIRNLSRITKIDYSSKDIIWNLGESDFMNEIYFEEDLNFSQQHSVQVLENGNLLFFDNHRYLNPQLSRCLELAYDESDYNVEIVWEHVLPAELFSGSRGECDRLENGNTLITAGRTGNTLEVTPNNEVAWQLSVENMGFDVTMYRSARIPNLHPIAFSVTLDNLNGSIDNPYIESNDGLLTANMHNWGWSEGWYHYLLIESNMVLLADSVFVTSFEDVQFNLDLSSLNLDDGASLVLGVYPANAEEKIQSFAFTLNNQILFGDLNVDGELNILDIVILANLILAGDNTNPAGDLNQDGNQNILDIVLLVNLILEGA